MHQIPRKMRSKFVEYVQGQLIGKTEDDQLINDAPLDRFFTGLLFPIMAEESSVDNEDEYATDTDAETKTTIQPIKKDKRYMPPSSAGFSFFITGEEIRLRVFYHAVAWKKDPDIRNEDGTFKPQSWTKQLLTEHDKELEFTPDGKTHYKIFGGNAKLDALWRKHNNGYIVTLTLSNQQKIPNNIGGRDFTEQRNKKTLFEVVFQCIVQSGVVAEYPATEKSLLNAEEKEIQLRHQDLKTYAVGHGVAANWRENKQNGMEIFADFMPQVEVPQVTADTGSKDGKVLRFEFLQQQNDEIIVELENFIKNYTQWIEKQQQSSEQEEDKETAAKIVKRLTKAKRRMLDGVALLKNDKSAKIAFATMNQAMLMQWVAGDKNKNIHTEKSSYQWRPFQLGFILMTLESTINENSDYRDTLDLIWFPTGGGKTEAYLGLMAFLFIYRRLQYSASHGGTITIMRYTLRLLTAQQFIRANKVIFALELIRQKNAQFGKEPFSSGLWLGRAISPNTFKQAKDYIEADKKDKFILSDCPWCKAKFNINNYRASDDSFHFYCLNPDCDFGQNPDIALPCNVVDEALYENPPSLLIATVDKFAGLVREERAGSFFGKNGNKPPELIIQDELHLISDALGSIVGLYEVGIETALTVRGARVKYIASTATIKNAKRQVETLFGKKMSLFPPSGLRYDDSYFAKTVPLSEKPGRLYVGYLAPLLGRQNCLSPLAATLLSAPTHLFKDDAKHMDNWWTQIIYHGSLKGLGNSSTLYQSSIDTKLKKIILENMRNSINAIQPDFCDDDAFKTLEDFQKIIEPEIKQIVDQYLPVRDLTTKELSSKKSAEENNKIFNDLEKNKDDNQSIDVALATNMVATGLDVSRLCISPPPLALGLIMDEEVYRRLQAEAMMGQDGVVIE